MKKNLHQIEWSTIPSIWQDPIIVYVVNVYRTATAEINQDCDDTTYNMWVSANNRMSNYVDLGVVSIYIIHALKESLYALYIIVDSSSREPIVKAIDLLTKYEEFLSSIDMLKY